MDRWGYYTRWADEERGRARLVPAWIEACILAAIVASLVGGRLIHGATERGPLGSCVLTGMPGVLAISLHSAGLLLGILAGPRIGLRLHSKELGWLCGVLIVVGFSMMLVWFGFPKGRL